MRDRLSPPSGPEGQRPQRPYGITVLRSRVDTRGPERKGIGKDATTRVQLHAMSAVPAQFDGKQFSKDEVSEKVVEQYDDKLTRIFYQCVMGAQRRRKEERKRKHAQGRIACGD